MAGGFWNYAIGGSRRPRRGRIRTAPSGAPARSRCAATAWSTACGRSGCSTGDTVAAVLPNGINPVTVYLGALESGLYYVPINYRLSAPEVAYILKDSDAKAFISHERFAELAVAAADEAGIPAEGAARGRQRSPGSATSTSWLAEPADSVPADRTAGAAMHYTSGTTGRPKGVKRKLSGLRRGRRGRALHRVLRPLRHPAPGQQRPPLHVAELPHRGHDVRRQRAELRPRGRLHGQVGPGADAGEDRAVPLHAHAHGADAVQPDAAAARRREDEVRRVVDEVGDPRRGAVPGRREAPDARLVGPRDLGVLRRDRGRRHDRDARGLAEVPRHRRQRLADLRAEDRRRRHRRGVRARRARASSGCAWARRTSSTRATSRRPTRATTRTGSSPSATSATSTRTASCSSATARAT